MNFFSQIFSNKVLGISMFACFLAQFIKIFTGKEKFIQFSRLFTSGGMPSSHSSFVTSLATLVGIERGFNSTDFAIVTVFALIIMYDASGVRRAVGKQATILNKILDDLHHKKHIEQKRLKELIGHTPKEVLFGEEIAVHIVIVLGTPNRVDQINAVQALSLLAKNEQDIKKIKGSSVKEEIIEVLRKYE